MSEATRAMFNDPKIAERYKGAERATAPFARSLIQQAGLLQAADKTPLVVFDNACGTGVVTAQLYEMLDEDRRAEMQVICGDFSEQMVGAVRQRIEENGWKGASARLVDAQKTGLPSNHFTHVITGFGIMAMADPTAAFNECYRVLQPNGTLALSTWRQVGWLPLVRAALSALPAPAPPFPSDEAFFRSWGTGTGHWDVASWVAGQLTGHSFVDVRVETEERRVVMGNVRQFVEGFGMMVGYLRSQFWSEGEREAIGEGTVTRTLEEELIRRYGEEGEIELVWEAVLATARKPVAVS